MPTEPRSCRCSHPEDEHDDAALGLTEVETVNAGWVWVEASRCHIPSCGCLRFRPVPTIAEHVLG